MKNGMFNSTVSRNANRLRKSGLKLTKSRITGGYGILAYDDVVDAWVEAEGMSPIPHSLSLEDVIRLTHEYMADEEIASLTA